MTSGPASSIDVVLSWSRAQAGTTVVLKQGDDGAWDEVGRTDSTEMTVAGLDPERAYVFAAAGLDEDGLVVPPDEWEVLRVAPMADEATPAAPSAPTGLAAAQDGPNLNLRWDAATDGVAATHEVRVGDSWEDGQVVATGLTGTTHSVPWSSSGDQTLHVKAFDDVGRASVDSASASLTVAPLDDHVTADESDQGAAAWPGTKTNLEADAGALRLARIPSWSTLATPWSLATWPWSAKVQPEGVYETPPFDAGQVEKQRVEIALGAAQPIDPLPWSEMHMPALGPKASIDGTLYPRGTRGFSSKNSWMLAPLAPVDARVEIDTSPTADGAWDGWRPFAPGTYGYWRSRLRVRLRSDGLRTVRTPSLVVTRRKFNRKLEGHVVVNCSPVDVVFPVPFQNMPKVSATIVGYAGTPIVSNVTPTGFTIAGGAAVFAGDPATFAPTVHWQAMGT